MNLLRTRSTRKTTQIQRLVDFHWDRISEDCLGLSKNDKIHGHSFNDIIYINDDDLHGKKPYKELLGIEMFLEDARFKYCYADKSHKPNFFDLIPQTFDKNYPEVAQGFRSRIASRLPGNIDQEFAGNVYSQPSAAEELVNNRDRIFKSIKKQASGKFSTEYKDLLPGKKVIDIQDMSHHAYNSINGILSYCATVNDLKYTLSNLADELFHDTADSLGNVKSAHILFPGPAFLETEWVKSLPVSSNDLSVTLYDASRAALMMYYSFSDFPARHMHGACGYSNFIPIGQSRNPLILKHNGLHNQDISSILLEMDVLSLMPNASVFYTVPTVDCLNQGHYCSSNDHFARNFCEELLLCNDPSLESYSELVDVPEGKLYLIGFKASDDILLKDQYLEDAVTLPKGTIMMLHKSYRFRRGIVNGIAARGKLAVSSNHGLCALTRSV